MASALMESIIDAKYFYYYEQLETGNVTPQQRASYTKWVMWSNSELDGICFGKNMGGTQLDKPNKALDTLEKILSKSDYLVNNVRNQCFANKLS